MAKHEHSYIEVSTSSILKFLLAILGFVVLYLLKDVLIIFAFAIVIASAVSPFVTWFEMRGLPRVLGVLLLYLMVFSVIVIVSSLLIPSISSDLLQLTTVFPKIIETVSTSLDVVQKESPKYFDFVGEIQNILDVFSSYLQQFSQSAVGLVVGIFGGVASFAAIIVISFYLSVMKDGIQMFLKSVVPREYETYAMDLWRRSELKVGRWLQGQLLLGLIVGLVVYVGLSLMDIRFALVFGILSMLLEIVPVAGPVLAAIPGVFIAFLQNPTLGLWVLLFYVVVQQLENHLLVPLVLGKTVGLNPVAVLMSLLIGGKLAGIPGAILAVPVATIIVEILDDMAIHKDNGNG